MLNYIKDKTIVTFVSHASLLINFNGQYILTDPWYKTKAFDSWTPNPPAAFSQEILLGLIKNKSVKIVVSHAHPDHIDQNFFKNLPNDTPIFIPKYKDGHFLDLLETLDLQNVTEIGTDNKILDDFKLSSYQHISSDYDSALLIETPDIFIFHGNDSWTLSNIEKNNLKKKINNTKKATLFMGQGGSASGFPLNYYKLSENQKDELLIDKNAKMINSLYNTSLECKFDYVLAYACFSSIDIEGKNYNNRAPVATADYCNEICKTDRFLDFSPGDCFFVNNKDLVVLPTFRSLYIEKEKFYHNNKNFKWPEICENKTKEITEKGKDFLFSLEEYLEKKVSANIIDINDVSINFKFIITDNNSKIISEINHNILNNISFRKKICKIRASVLYKVLEGEIAFENLSIGYLAEWDRDPFEVYNKIFMTEIKTFWNIYVEK